MSMEKNIEHIAQKLMLHPLFVGMLDDELKKIAEIVEIEEYAPGDEIIREGEIGDALYVIESGEVEIIKQVSGAGTKKIATLSGEISLISQHEGGFFGEMALLDTEPRSATVRAESQTVVYKLSSTVLNELYSRNRDLQLIMVTNIARILSRRLRATSKRKADQE